MLDPLELSVLALGVGEAQALIISLDLEGVKMNVLCDMRREVSKATDVAEDAIFVSATHTHTGPCTVGESILPQESAKPITIAYTELVKQRMIEVSKLALADMSGAQPGFATGQAPNVAFVRRFRMKDGSIRTNPGVNNPDVLEPIGDVDESVHVIRFRREGADDIVLAHFANHPDVVGGSKISGDWPALTRRTVEKVLDHTKCIVLNGAQGDVNHVNIHPTGGYFNDMFMDFDDVARGYAHALYIARVVTGGVLQAFDKVQYFDVDCLKALQRSVRIPSNMPDPKELPLAREYCKLHREGRDDEIPFTGMMLTTVVAEAERMLALEHGPESYDMPLSALRLGKVALFGVPGEPFTGIGRAMKHADDLDLVLTCCLTNGNEGYFPMREAYDEGGYEAKSSFFRAGVAELLIDEGKRLLADMR